MKHGPGRRLSRVLAMTVIMSMLITLFPAMAFESSNIPGTERQAEKEIEAGPVFDSQQPAEAKEAAEPTGESTTSVKRAPENPEPKTADSIVLGDYIYSISRQSITGYTGTATEITIPSVLKSDDGKEYAVKKIDEGAFQPGNTDISLTSVILPAGLEEIGNKAFAGNSIEELIIPESLKKIGADGFSDNKLTKITVEKNGGLESIGADAFARNQLEIIDLSEASSLSEIGKEAFAWNKLSSLNLGKAIRSIGERAFAENKLTEVKLPATVENYGNNVFSDNERYVFVTCDS